jgi:acyl carrier protein
MQTDAVITGFVKNDLLRGEEGRLPSPEESLVDSGILDSVSVLRLLIFVEEHFAITISDEEVTPDNLGSIKRIAAFIDRKKSDVTVRE